MKDLPEGAGSPVRLTPQITEGILQLTIKLTIKRDENILELGQLPNSTAEQTERTFGKFQSSFQLGILMFSNSISQKHPHQKNEKILEKKIAIKLLNIYELNSSLFA